MNVTRLPSVACRAGYIPSVAPGVSTNNPFSGPHTTSIVATSSAIGSSERRQKMTMATTAKPETKTASRVTL
jgi:hypothetical protein